MGHEPAKLDGSPTGRLIRRYERTAPGEPIYLDAREVGRLSLGGS
ncbi:hypothetical protein [Candidatus Poriferisodalis sp.]